jgi:hypothetical protein
VLGDDRAVWRAVVLGLGAFLLAASASATTLDNGKPKIAITKGAQAWAGRINLKLGDFPAGWRAEPDKSDDSSSKCFDSHGGTSLLTINGRAESAGFHHGDVPFVKSLAAVFATAPQARTMFAVLRNALADCLVSELDKERDLQDTSGGPLNFPHLGDRSFAFQVLSHVKEGSLSVAAYFDFVLIQRGRAIALGAFGDAFDPFDSGLEARLARAMAQRMKLRS